MKWNEENLKYRGRYLRTQPGKLLFGPAGERLAADYLEKQPGFVGRFDFIHKCNLPELFRVTIDCPMDFRKATADWYPSYLHMECEDRQIVFREDKWITRDDVAVSRQTWFNQSGEARVLRLLPGADICRSFGRMPHGYRVHEAVFSHSFDAGGSCLLPSGAAVTVTVCAGVGNQEQESREQLRERAVKAEALACQDTALAGHREAYGEFFQAIPEFVCSDQLLNKVWSYRWYLLKNSWAVPGWGKLPHGVMYEGRGHKMDKTPGQANGWEFTRLIPLSTPFHIMEMKWRTDRIYVEEMIHSLIGSQDEKGFFRVTAVDTYGVPYANAALWAIWQYALIHGDAADFLRPLLPALEKYLNAHETFHTDGKSLLQIEKIHQRTGKEYQPSYWYFHGFPQDCRDPEVYTWLKRVDRSVYHYLNMKGMAGLYRRFAMAPEAGRWEEKAARLAQEIQNKMWEKESGFFYDLHWETEEKAMVKNIVGFYPFWAGITDSRQSRALSMLEDPALFGTAAMYPSVAADCPAYSPAGGWMGQFIKGRDGCVWDGPSWPYTNGIILDMLARQSKGSGHIFDEMFRDGLYRYAYQHFKDGNPECPYLVEHYHPETGEVLSDEADYNHSFFLELIFAHVIGITVLEDRVEIDPVEVGLEWYRCTGIRIRGHELSVEKNVPDNGAGEDPWYRVTADGNCVYEGKGVKKLVLEWK